MKNFILGVIATFAALAIGTLSYLRLGLAEVRSNVEPPVWESYLMHSAVHASVQREAPDLPNPVPPTSVNLIAGGKDYLVGCAGCHGAPGTRSNRPRMYPPAPQLSEVGTEYTEAQIFWILRHGIRRTGMFADGEDSDQELWALAAFVKRINALPPGVKDELAKASKSGV